MIAASRFEIGPFLDTAVHLMTLPENWDSYGARPIDPRFVYYGLSLLNDLMRKRTPSPAMVPTSMGGIQLEWHNRGIDLEVRIESLRSIYVSYEDERTGTQWEGTLSSASVRRLDQFVADLSQRI